jgi:hypothetical protein
VNVLPLLAALGVGTIIGGVSVFLFQTWVRAYPDACVRALQGLDRCMDAAIISMMQNAAGKADAKETKAVYAALTKLHYTVNDVFGHTQGPPWTRLQSALIQFENAIDPADGLSQNTAATAATVDEDVEKLRTARHELRRAMLFIAERHFLFKLYGRHNASG